MFEVIPVNQDRIDRSLPNKPLSSYSLEEKQAILDRYDTLRNAGKDENTALSEIDVSMSILEKWRLDCVTKTDTSVQIQVPLDHNRPKNVVELNQTNPDEEKRSRPLKPASSYTKEERKDILDRYDALMREGKTMSATLSEVGVSINSIRKWRAEYTAKATLELISQNTSPIASLEPLTTLNVIKKTEESPPVASTQTLQKKGKRKLLRNVLRKYSFEEKQALLGKFAELVKSGVDEQVALTKLGLTYNTIYEWREELEAKKKLESNRKRSFEKQSQQPTLDRLDSKEQLPEPPQKAKQETKQKIEQQKHEKEYHRIKPKLAKYHSLRSAGKTAHEAAALIGMSYRQVRRWINSGRFPGLEGKTRKTYNLEEQQELLARYNDLISEGYLPRFAAAKIGLPPAKIASWQKKQNVSPPLHSANPGKQNQQPGKAIKGSNTRNSFSIEQQKAIVAEYNELRNDGFRHEVAVQKVNVSRASIDRWRKKFATTSQETTSATSGLSMVLQNGKRIEGLTLDQVIEIAKNG